MNADTAGLTHTGGEPNPGQPVAATTAELYHSVVHTASGALDSMFRMEPATPAPVVSTATESPAGSVGVHGGRIPSAVSGILTAVPGAAPGPQMGASPFEPGPTGQVFDVPPGGWDPVGQLIKPTPVIGTTGLLPPRTNPLNPDAVRTGWISLRSSIRRWLGV